MPKTKKRKRITPNVSSAEVAVEEKGAREVPPRRTRRRTNGASLQNVTFAAMLTCGFLGMAVFFAFFYAEDTNHYLYAGLAALTALGWLFLLARRWSQYRQRA